MSEVAIEFDNQLKDHLHAYRLYYSHGVLSKIDKVVAVVLLGAGIALMLIVGVRWWCFVPFLLAICEWFDLLSIRPLQIRLFFKNNPKFRERYHLRFSPDGIHFKTGSIDSELAWTHYQRMVESNQVFLLIYGKRMYTVIPKSAFKEISEMDRFRDLVRTSLGGGPELPTRTSSPQG